MPQPVNTMPTQFISVNISPEENDFYYCIVQNKLTTNFDRMVVEYAIGGWDEPKGWEVTDWLCEDADFIAKVNA